MKKFGIVLLALGLIVAFSMSASAADVKFSGEYWARGSYISNPSLLTKEQGAKRDSFSYYDQRMRLVTQFKVADGLTLTTRFDALETVWGKPDADSYNNNDNISFERSFADFKTGIGSFRVGYQGFYTFGPTFFDNSSTFPGIVYSNTFGPVKIAVDTYKNTKGNWDTAADKPVLDQSDADWDVYDLEATTKFKGGDAGLKWTFQRNATTRTTAATSYKRELHIIDPYVRAKVGIFDLEAEGYWMTGDWKKMDVATAANPDVKADAQGLFLNAKANLGKAYAGGTFIYMTGDKTETADKMEGGMNATLKYAQDKEIFGTYTSILFGEDYHDYLSTKGNATELKKNMDNVWYYQVYGGYKLNKFDFMGRFTIAKADQVATGYDKDYGKELDLKATYSIYDNLTYNVGLAYLWTGDYFKGATGAQKETANTYYALHWIDLVF